MLQVVNGFSGQSDPEIKGKVITRLQNITEMQKVLMTCLAGNNFILIAYSVCQTVKKGFKKSAYDEGVCQSPTVWPHSSEVRILARSAKDPGFESRSGYVLFPVLWHLVAQRGSVHGLRAAKGPLVCSGMVPSRFWDKSIKAGGVCHSSTVWPMAQWSEFSHSLCGVLGSSHGQIMCFFLPCDTLVHSATLSSTEVGPRCEKTSLRGFRPGPTQTGLFSDRRWLEVWNFGFRK